jgi:hypothetical protein
MPDHKPAFKSYAEFWPYYLSEHSRHATRMMHVVGAVLALFALAKAVLYMSFGWLVVALIFGYGFAWTAHAFVEKNRPATFSHPLWSLRGDFHMLGLWLTGKLEIELTRHNILT